jgi:hypothetical protein
VFWNGIISGLYSTEELSHNHDLENFKSYE